MKFVQRCNMLYCFRFLATHITKKIHTFKFGYSQLTHINGIMRTKKKDSRYIFSCASNPILDQLEGCYYSRVYKLNI